MAYEPGAIDAALAAALGEEAGLIAELRLAFSDSATRTLAAMDAADDGETWRTAAARLRGLAASFGAVALMALAAEAADARPGDATMLDRLRRTIEQI